MRLLLTFSCALSTATILLAQPQIDNSDFENWEGAGSSAEPLEWSSIKTSTGGVAFALPQVCFQSNDAFSGASSLRIRSGILPAQTVTGIVTNGRVHASQTEGGYLYTDAANSQWHTPLTDRPDSLVVWYKATPQGSDFPGIQATLHFGAGRIPEGGTLANWVADAVWTGAPGLVVSQWTRLSIPFNYLSEQLPEFILVGLTSSQVGNALANSEVIYDQLSLIYNITPLLQESVATVTPTEGYPLTVDFSTPGTPLATTTFVAELSDSNGSFANPVNIGSVSTAATVGTILAIIPASTPSGDGYRVRVSNVDPNYAPLSVPLEVILSTEVGIGAISVDRTRVTAYDGFLSVDLSESDFDSPHVDILNASGQVVWTRTLTSGNAHRLPMNFPPGFYLVRLTDAKQSVSQRLVVP